MTNQEPIYVVATHDEGVANDLGYVWDNDYKCWCGIGVYSIDDYQNNKEWFDSEVDIEAVDTANC